MGWADRRAMEFWRWWSNLQEAKVETKGKVRTNGQDHIEVTVNFLWQRLKAKNEQNFNNVMRGELWSFNKAVTEWEEFKCNNATTVEIKTHKP